MPLRIRLTAFTSVVMLAIRNVEFRKALVKSPKKTAESAGFKLTDGEIKAIKSWKAAEWDNMTVKDLNKRIDAVSEGAGVDSGNAKGGADSGGVD